MENNLTMKWYKFLIYFWLWFSSLTHIIEGFLLLGGFVYSLSGSSAEAVYGAYPGLKTVDLYGGIIFLVLALVGLSVRGKLKNFKESAPQNFYAFLALELMADVIYMILTSYMKGEGAPWVPVVLASVLWGVFFFLNFVYFKKRKDLFIR